MEFEVLAAPAEARTAPRIPTRAELVELDRDIRAVFAPELRTLATRIQDLGPAAIRRLYRKLNLGPFDQTYPASYWEAIERQGQRSQGAPQAIPPRRQEIAPRSEEEAAHLSSVYAMIDRNTAPVREKAVYQLAPGRVERFLWAPTETAVGELDGATVRYVIAPIGERGELISAHILNATRVMLHFAEMLWHQDSERLAVTHRELLLDHTARGNDLAYTNMAYTNSRIGQVPMLILHEGIISIGHSLLHAAMERGSLADAELIRALTNADVPALLALSSPMGFIGPTMLKGRFIPELVKQQIGKATLNHAILVELGKHRRAQWTPKEGEKDMKQFVRSRRNLTGRGCPVAGADLVTGDGGLRDLSQAFLWVSDALSGER